MTYVKQQLLHFRHLEMKKKTYERICTELKDTHRSRIRIYQASRLAEAPVRFSSSPVAKEVREG
jgi:hypothetical protein